MPGGNGASTNALVPPSSRGTTRVLSGPTLSDNDSCFTDIPSTFPSLRFIDSVASPSTSTSSDSTDSTSATSNRPLTRFTTTSTTVTERDVPFFQQGQSIGTDFLFSDPSSALSSTSGRGAMISRPTSLSQDLLISRLPISASSADNVLMAPPSRENSSNEIFLPSQFNTGILDGRNDLSAYQLRQSPTLRRAPSGTLGTLNHLNAFLSRPPSVSLAGFLVGGDVIMKSSNQVQSPPALNRPDSLVSASRLVRYQDSAHMSARMHSPYIYGDFSGLPRSSSGTGTATRRLTRAALQSTTFVRAFQQEEMKTIVPVRSRSSNELVEPVPLVPSPMLTLNPSPSASLDAGSPSQPDRKVSKAAMAAMKKKKKQEQKEHERLIREEQRRIKRERAQLEAEEKRPKRKASSDSGDGEESQATKRFKVGPEPEDGEDIFVDDVDHDEKNKPEVRPASDVYTREERQERIALWKEKRRKGPKETEYKGRQAIANGRKRGPKGEWIPKTEEEKRASEQKKKEKAAQDKKEKDEKKRLKEQQKEAEIREQQQLLQRRRQQGMFGGSSGTSNNNSSSLEDSEVAQKKARLTAEDEALQIRIKELRKKKEEDSLLFEEEKMKARATASAAQKKKKLQEQQQLNRTLGQISGVAPLLLMPAEACTSSDLRGMAPLLAMREDSVGQDNNKYVYQVSPVASPTLSLSASVAYPSVVPRIPTDVGYVYSGPGRSHWELEDVGEPPRLPRGGSKGPWGPWSGNNSSNNSSSNIITNMRSLRSQGSISGTYSNSNSNKNDMRMDGDSRVTPAFARLASVNPVQLNSAD